MGNSRIYIQYIVHPQVPKSFETDEMLLIFIYKLEEKDRERAAWLARTMKSQTTLHIILILLEALLFHHTGRASLLLFTAFNRADSFNHDDALTVGFASTREDPY